MRALLAASAAALALALGASGCSTPPIRVYADGAAEPRLVVPDEASIRAAGDEPTVCLFALRERRQSQYAIWFMDAGKFGGFRFLTRENPNPRGCGVLVSIRQTGVSVYGTSYVDVYSIHGGKLLWNAQGEGRAGPWMGFQTIAVYLKSAIQSGGEMRAKLDALQSAAPPVGTDWITKTAGSDLLSWDEILSYVSKRDVRLHAMRDAEIAQARAWVAEAAQAPAPAPEPAAKDDPNAWWAK